ncbi:signal-induced proliferation-associated 1-like protein 3 [Platysternon megacephalum]|uniref:Signal-induced proliferation-associated 1-like protein 3 n=1 Tax=Platysternon megacephalum TaxID=55544 RepID=A0A4D9DVN6_9SAUR|nr:signal-induced proliferation-associated 1-like protein 3 [Platysternon megacephalum]
MSPRCPNNKPTYGPWKNATQQCFTPAYANTPASKKSSKISPITLHPEHLSHLGFESMLQRSEVWGESSRAKGSLWRRPHQQTFLLAMKATVVPLHSADLSGSSAAWGERVFSSSQAL